MVMHVADFRWPCGARRYKDEPYDYLNWHDWAEKKSRTHRQLRYSKCKRYHVWRSKR